MDSDSDIFDVTTVKGRYKSILHRFTSWKSIALAVAIFVCLMLFFFSYSDGDSDPPEEPSFPNFNLTSSLGKVGLKPLKSKTIKSRQDLQFTYTSYNERPIFLGVPANLGNRSMIKNVRIKTQVLDAQGLTSSLRGMTSVESIVIETMEVVNQFSRVVLPNMREFNYSLYRKVNIDFYKPPDVLHGILFFDRYEGQNWTVKPDVLNLGVNISVWVYGTAVLEVNRARGIININTHYCQDILENAKGDYTSLVLSWCKLSNVSEQVSPKLKYLNLNNAVPSPQNLEALLRRTPLLEEVHLFQPYLKFDEFAPSYYVYPEDPEFMTPLDLAVLPKTVTKLSLSKFSLISTTTVAEAVTNIKELSLEECNVTKPVLENFSMLFSKLEVLRLFNAGSYNETFDRILNETVKIPSLKAIVLTQYAFKSQVLNEFADVTKYQKMAGNIANLQVFGTSGVFMARLLGRNETDYVRFKALGFDVVDTFVDYLHYDSVDAVTSASYRAGSLSILVFSLCLLGWMSV